MAHLRHVSMKIGGFEFKRGFVNIYDTQWSGSKTV